MGIAAVKSPRDFVRQTVHGSGSDLTKARALAVADCESEFPRPLAQFERDQQARRHRSRLSGTVMVVM